MAVSAEGRTLGRDRDHPNIDHSQPPTQPGHPLPSHRRSHSPSRLLLPLVNPWRHHGGQELPRSCHELWREAGVQVLLVTCGAVARLEGKGVKLPLPPHPPLVPLPPFPTLHCLPTPHLGTRGPACPAGSAATRTEQCSKGTGKLCQGQNHARCWGVPAERGGPSLTWKVAMTLLRACWKRSSSDQAGCCWASAVARWLWYRNQAMLSACRKGFSFPQALPRSARATITISGGCHHWVWLCPWLEEHIQPCGSSPASPCPFALPSSPSRPAT